MTEPGDIYVAVSKALTTAGIPNDDLHSVRSRWVRSVGLYGVASPEARGLLLDMCRTAHDRQCISVERHDEAWQVWDSNVPMTTEGFSERATWAQDFASELDALVACILCARGPKS